MCGRLGAGFENLRDAMGLEREQPQAEGSETEEADDPKAVVQEEPPPLPAKKRKFWNEARRSTAIRCAKEWLIKLRVVIDRTMGAMSLRKAMTDGEGP